MKVKRQNNTKSCKEKKNVKTYENGYRNFVKIAKKLTFSTYSVQN